MIRPITPICCVSIENRGGGVCLNTAAPMVLSLPCI